MIMSEWSNRRVTDAVVNKSIYSTRPSTLTVRYELDESHERGNAASILSLVHSRNGF